MVAHRGASGLAPENTLAAFHLAVQLGAPAVECDVHLSADGIPVVIHDATLDRTTNGTGEVFARSLQGLRGLDAGIWFGPQFAGERLPTLDETLAVCAGRARLFVELKRGGGPALVEAALHAIAQAPQTPVAVISFGPDEVREVARLRPDLPLGFLIGRQPATQAGPQRATEMARELGAGFLSPEHSVVDASFVDAARAAALPLSVWTVDDPARMRELADLGVDAITTNRPDVALELFAGRARPG
ncbi:MAG: Glycerophosphoryl diester phosphodiesterase [uncultured Chloroflexi bacterium]|uniref:Glycerophosphoryl diester phosphodiesterase n=1 Tax=uncultured Chloroflexota bacterium TaxID=166587 RepID=A0A6J4IMM3_9CHLR|nr:MAG: Glycerophosphoryl diester phosphodiesterase [uncultured Chloroflexota bacterium]